MGGKSDSQKVRVTQYFATVHYGICHGPLDYISQIFVNEKEAWSGEQGNQGSISISRKKLFGGNKKEGGVEGLVEYLPGGPTQTIPEVLAAKAGRTTATMPAYRGIASAWFYEGNFQYGNDSGFYWTANSPFLPGVWIKVARASTALNEEHARIWRAAGAIAGDEVELEWWQSTFEQGDNDAARLGIAYFDISGSQIGSTTWATAIATAEGVWTKRTLTSTVPENTSEVRIYIELIRNTGTHNDGYIDDIVLTVEGVQVFLNNAGAESGTAEWTNEVGGITSAASNADGLLPHSGGFFFAGGNNAVTRAYQSLRVGGFDSNPAHIIYECLTNAEWGMGGAASAIDVPSFEYAAEVLYDEGFGLSMIWSRQTTVEAFISEVLDHIEATLFVSPRTGQLTLKLIRDDFSISDLPIFTPDNSVVTKFSRKLWGETINEVVVSWTNPENEEEETVVAQDLANIATQGNIVSDSRNYYGVRVKALAAQLAQRDLRSSATPLASCDIEVDRSGWDLLPGDVCILDSPDDGIEQIIMRVGPVEYGRPGDATVKASLVEDVFSLALSEYTVPPDTEAEDTAEQPSAADDTLILTLPYFFTVSEIDASIRSTLVYPEVFAGVLASEDGLDTIEFDLYGEVTDTLGNVSIDDLGTKSIASRGTLPQALDAEVSSIIASFPDRTRGNGPSIGSFMLIEGADETEHELCVFTGQSGSSLSWEFNRGILDTIPRAWPIGTPIWFIDDTSVFADQTVRSEAETVDYQVLPTTSLGQLALEDAPVITETLTGRPYLPTRPAAVTVDLDDGFSGIVDVTGVDPIPVAFARRNRLTEDSIVLAWDDADVTPEASQTTTVRVLDLDDNILHEYTAIAGTSEDIVVSDLDGAYEGYVEVTAVRDSLESLQPYRVRISLVPTFEFEDGEPYQFEDGEYKVFEDAP